MKMNILNKAFAIIIAFAAIAACKPEPDPVVVPAFPTSVINKTVAAGESVQITIEPNMAWEVTISGDGIGNMFWIDDAGMKATRISGKEAGIVVFDIRFSDDEEFDVNRICEVNLEMGGQSKKIATITRPSLGRTFEVYAAVAGETGFTETFGTDKLTSASLVTFAGEASYTLPVRVVTNYAWSIALPSWLKATDLDGKTVLSSGKSGSTEFLLSAVLSEDVIGGVEGTVKFLDSANTDSYYELAVTLPEVASRVEYEYNSLEFNKEGQLLMPNGSYADGTSVIYVLAAQGAVVKALEWKGEWHDTAYAEWVDIQMGEYSADGGVLQTVDVQIGVSENAGAERYADIFIFPVSLGNVNAEDICDMNDPSCGFKAEYAKYHVGRLVQSGEIPPYIIPISSEELRNEVGTYFSVLEPKAESNVMQWDFPEAPTYHKITYTGEWSADEGSFECEKPFASVTLYKDTDYPYGFFSETVSADDDHWISFTSFGGENMKGRFNMNYVPDSPTHTAAIFYDEAGNILSAVLVEFNPSATGGGDNFLFKVTTGDAEISKMDQSTELYMALNGNYNITEAYTVVTNDRMIYVEAPEQYWNVIALDPASLTTLSGCALSFEGASPNFYVYTGSGSEKAEAVYVFQKLGVDGESYVNYAAVHVIYDPSASIETVDTFTFVYPDYVNGMATLSIYEGDMLQTIMDEQWGLKASDVYELKYTDPSAASVAIINVPGAPQGDAAWNNWPYAEDYWLQHEMNGTQMTVFMSEAGKTDYFVFYDSTGLPSCALVCTMVPAL